MLPLCARLRFSHDSLAGLYNHGLADARSEAHFIFETINMGKTSKKINSLLKDWRAFLYFFSFIHFGSVKAP